MSAQQPAVGRIVHYTNLGDKDGKYPPQTLAAIVTAVQSIDRVSLKVFYPTGIFDMESVPRTDAEAGTDEARGHWGWPALLR